MLIWSQGLIVKTVEISVGTGLKNRAGHNGQPALVRLWLGSVTSWRSPRPVWAINISSSMFWNVCLYTAAGNDYYICFFTVTRLQMSSPDRPSSARDVITLKVKSEDGNHTYMLKMCFSETIGHLRQHLDKHRWDLVLLHGQSIFFSLQHVTLVACVSCITEGVVSLIMTSSVHTHSAATTMTTRRSNRAVWCLMLLCCCERSNALIHWLKGIK